MILAWLLFGCWLMVEDIWLQCKRQTEQAEHEELLEILWDDGWPRAVNREDVHPVRGTEAS